MGTASDYRARADHIARAALGSPSRRVRLSRPTRPHATCLAVPEVRARLRQLGACRRELRQVKGELWTTMHRIRAAYLRRRIGAAGAWCRPWATWVRMWLRHAEGATLVPYRATARRIDAHLARIDAASAPLARRLASDEEGRAGR